MTRASVAAVLLVVGVVAVAVVGGAGCREEPTIVIKFEPNDMSGGKRADLGTVATAAAKPADLGAAPADLAVAAKKGPAGKTQKGAAAECKVAADCVIEPIECCDCANGGKQHVVTKKVAVATRAARAAKCKTAVCTMMLSTDPSCGQRADCVDGACVMVKK
jgi:hypothetical protein